MLLCILFLLRCQAFVEHCRENVCIPPPSGVEGDSCVVRANMRHAMFADPSAAARRSAEVQGNVGNSAWGRRLRQFQFKHPGRPKTPVLCDGCKQLFGDPATERAKLIHERIKQHEAQQVVDGHE